MKDIAAEGDVSVSVNKAGHAFKPASRTVTVHQEGTQVDMAVWQTGGSDNPAASKTTTGLALSFDPAIEGLDPGDITLTALGGGNSGVAVSPGTLTGNGSVYAFGVSGIDKPGTILVSVSKSGYAVSDPSKGVDVFYAAPVTLSVTANGGANATTAKLRLTFDRSVTGLTKENIAVENVTGLAAMNNESLTASGNTLDLPVTVTKSGLVNVSVSKSGYAVSSSSQTGVQVYYAEAVTLIGVEQIAAGKPRLRPV